MTRKTSIPKTLGGCADKLYALREKRQALQRQVDDIKKDENLIKEKLIQNLSKDDARGVLGRRARAAIVTKRVAAVRDWDKFYRHILKTRDFSLMQRRVSDPAVNERWEDDKQVPGVEPFTVIKVSVTKTK